MVATAKPGSNGLQGGRGEGAEEKPDPVVRLFFLVGPPIEQVILLPLIGDCHRCMMTDECENIKPLIMVTFKRYMEGERLVVQEDLES
jgi:hypothetical protein